MASEVGVINRALIELGQKRIVARTDTSTEAVTMDALFDDVRDTLLRSHQWNFATKRLKLARSANTPSHEFDYQYPVPSDWLRTVEVSSSDAGGTDIRYKMGYDATDTLVFLCDATELWLTYIAQVTDVASWGPDFRTVLSYELAKAATITLKNSRALRDDFRRDAQAAWTRATGTDAIEDMPDRRPDGSWTTSRGGGQYPRNYWPR